MKQVRVARGFAAIAAIFLIVILAALGGFMLTFSNTQQLTSTQDLQGTRAYWAARAGLEWGIGSVAASVAVPPACPVIATSSPGSTVLLSTTPLAMNFDGGFSVTVICSRTDYTEAAAAANRFIYQISSVAKASGAPGAVGYVERSLSASLER